MICNRADSLRTYLTYAGACPFIVCALYFLTDLPLITINVEQILSIYSLIIISFMAGSHWGLHLNMDDKWAIYLSFSSNIMAILLWLSYLMFSFKVLMIIFAASFTALLLIDKQMFYDGLISKRYWLTRRMITLIVVLTLGISGLYA